MKSNSLFFLCIFLMWTSCNRQTSYQKNNIDELLGGDLVEELGSSAMVVYQDQQDHYWFGSWETGVYKYDGNKLINYTTKHGLLNNRIDEIKEDEWGNMYFASANARSEISKLNGNSFTTITAVPSENWKLEPTDLWFKDSYENTGKVYRYDGTTLFELQLPNPPNLSNPFAVYSIYRDKKENIWFGTNPVGVCRYDGNTFDWITEEDVTEFRNEGANGVRSILEDQNGVFWFNTEFRYSVYDSATLNAETFYTRHPSIGGLDGKDDSNLDEYLSSAIDDRGNLWFVTYLDGVWKYDGRNITNYVVQDKGKDISLFSIYKDRKGDLWLGTHNNGVYKLVGQTFVKFT